MDAAHQRWWLTATPPVHCPAAQRLEVEDGLCVPLLRTLGRGWGALQEVLLVSCLLGAGLGAGWSGVWCIK